MHGTEEAARQLARQADELDHLHERVTDLRDFKNNAAQRIKELENELVDAKIRLDGAELEVTRAKRHARDRSGAAKRTRDSLEEARGERDHHQSEVHRLEGELAKKQRELDEIVTNAGAQIQTLREALRDELQRANDGSDEIKELKRELNRTRRASRTAMDDRMNHCERLLARERATSADLRRQLEMQKNKKRFSQKAAASIKQRLKRVRKREADAKAHAREEQAFFKVRRTSKPFHQLSKKQQSRTNNEMKRRLGTATEKIHAAFQVKGCGPMRFVVNTQPCLAKMSGMTTSVSMQKGSVCKEEVQKMLMLRDTMSLSKKKIHEMHMLHPDILPSVPDMTKEEREFAEQMQNVLDMEANDEEFHVDPKSWVRHLMSHRGLVRPKDSTIHLLIEADGRGTGNSHHSVTMQMRMSNEGTATFRNDRSHLPSMVAGKESCEETKNKLGKQFRALEDLQTDGLILEDGTHTSVKMHFTSDAKFAQISHGMMSFKDRGCNCLHCRCHSTDRANLEERHCIHPNRFGRVGRHGQKREDLLAFVPMDRRWSEGVHIVMRLCHDKLIKKAFQDASCVNLAETRGYTALHQNILMLSDAT